MHGEGAANKQREKVYDQGMQKQKWLSQRIKRIIDAVKRFLKPEPPEDPYAYVTARRRPRPGGRSAAAVVERPD